MTILLSALFSVTLLAQAVWPNITEQDSPETERKRAAELLARAPRVLR